MSSIRNAPVDIASTRILQYLRTHNYDDCAIYINRLHSSTFRKILTTDLSLDILLGQLPFSIEIFEVIYSKIFIIEPDSFPLRILKPEQLISRMISIFSIPSSSSTTTTTTIEKSPSSTSVISKPKEQFIDDERLLSNLASILRIISYVQPILFKRLLRQKETIDECILYFEQRHTTVTNTSTLKKSTSLTHINLEENIRHELESTIHCCQQALHKLGTKTIAVTMPSVSSTSAHSTPATPRKHNSMRTSTSAISSITTTSTINSLDDIQKRLYQHKAILNLIEPYLSRTKLYTTINNLTYKVSIDKQILLAYAHIKVHEKHIPFNEPLLPLFKRFAFGYERIIQLWRRVADSTLIDECTDDILIDDTTVKGASGIGGICFERTRSQNELPLYKDDMAVKNGPLNAINFHSICPKQPLNTINNHMRKQQPTNKLINTYLSTAAQYLNRTKSFHVPQTTTVTNNNRIQTGKNYHQQVLLTNNSNLARSVPSNINNLNSKSIIPNSPIKTINYHEQQYQTISSDINSNENNKSQGIVNTLRRSLRKNKERFYNKRSTTMKSCNSLNTYESSNIIQPQISMTPTLLCRRQYLENQIDSLTKLTMENNISINFINHDESEKDDRMPPLQSLGLNGRNRIYISPSSSSSFIQQPQQTILPSATSLQSLSPLISNISVTNPNQQQITSSDQDEKERLKNDLIQLKTELQKSKETIARLQKSEEQMRERLAEQAQRQLERGGKFEDLNQIARPTELIRSYNSLYSQARIDALDALDNIREMSNAEDLKSKLLFSVVVLAFRHAQNQAKDIRNKIKQILQLTNDKSSIVLEETIEKYLRTTIQKYDVTKITYEVENQLWTTLYDYPHLKTCHELLKYIHSACRTAWGLVNQTPPYYIEFQTTKYDKQIHERFHTSDNESETITEYIWPCLIDGRDRTCVAKGVVLTDDQNLTISKNLSS